MPLPTHQPKTHLKKSRQHNANTPHNDSQSTYPTIPIRAALHIQPPLTPRNTHIRRKTRKTPVQRPNSDQLNIFQCKAWNPSPTTHAPNPTPATTIPNPQTTEADLNLRIPTSQETPSSTHLHTPKQPTRGNTNHAPPLGLPHTKPEYTHQSLKALNLNTHGMHTKILDLQNILSKYPDPNIIALTETKHCHIKSIWRQALRNYKLVYNPSLYNKHTKSCSGGTILAIHKKTPTQQ
jgi:hypothetical protein